MRQKHLTIFLAAIMAPLLLLPLCNAAQISRLRDAEISNNNTVDADDIDVEFNQLVTESNSQDTRLTDIESNALTIGGVKTFSSAPLTNQIDERTAGSGVTIDSVLHKDGFIRVPAGAGFTPTTNADFGYDSTSHTYDGMVNGSAVYFVHSGNLATQTLNYPIGFHGSAVPAYASSTTFTQAFIRERNADNDGNITKASSTTVDISTTGINGIAQSSNLTGTIAVTSGAASVTGTSTAFSTDFQVGDVICDTDTSECRRITVIGSNTSITVESNWGSTDASSTFKRGGRAPSTHYYLYGIDNGATPGLLLSTRNVAGGDTLADLPSGYSDYRQQAFSILTTSGTPTIQPFYVSAGWPDRPSILYQLSFVRNNQAANTTEILSAGTATSFTDVDATAFIPKISRLGIFYVSESTAGNYVSLRENGSSLTSGLQIVFSSNNDTRIMQSTLDSSRVFEYLVLGGDADISVYGYVVTEVP